MLTNVKQVLKQLFAKETQMNKLKAIDLCSQSQVESQLLKTALKCNLTLQRRYLINATHIMETKREILRQNTKS